MSWIIYILILLFCLLQINKISIQKIDKKILFISIGAKVLFGVLYILIFTYYFSNGTIYGDSGQFFNDSKELTNIGYQNISDYLRILFNPGDLQTPYYQKLLENTHIWDSGNNGDSINDNRLIIRINSIIHFFSFGNIYLHALIFSIIGFFGSLLIYRSFENFIEHKKTFWLTLVFWPTIGFWGSSLIKETILFFAFGLFCYSLKNLATKNINLKSVTYLVISIILLCFNKPYAGLFIIASSLIFTLGYFYKWEKKGIIISVILTISITILTTYSPPKINLLNKISYKQNDLNNMGKGGIAFITDSSFCVFPYDQLDNFEINNNLIQVKKETIGQFKLFGKTEFYQFNIKPSEIHYETYLIYPPSDSYLEPKLIKNSRLQLLKNIPSALLNVFIRPFPWDNGDPLKILVFICNICLLLLLSYSFYNRRSLNSKTIYLVFSLTIASIFIALIIGLSIPIFGAIVRYKSIIDLFIIIISFILLKQKTHETSSSIN